MSVALSRKQLLPICHFTSTLYTGPDEADADRQYLLHILEFRKTKAWQISTCIQQPAKPPVFRNLCWNGERHNSGSGSLSLAILDTLRGTRSLWITLNIIQNTKRRSTRPWMISRCIHNFIETLPNFIVFDLVYSEFNWPWIKFVILNCWFLGLSIKSR